MWDVAFPKSVAPGLIRGKASSRAGPEEARSRVKPGMAKRKGSAKPRHLSYPASSALVHSPSNTASFPPTQKVSPHVPIRQKDYNEQQLMQGDTWVTRVTPCHPERVR